ncbi:aminomethyltransferase [Simiduia agarivorans SA1 = DSM 21679]|uniref:Aminomethyltransferase n=2 Tax=Simiduia TaxID=447467 RepID=K4KG03_SIMAS|nr:aminomethyltransferase [Simiduia agarivorans SA1 = DSM 21679]
MLLAPEGFALHHQAHPEPDLQQPLLLSLDCLAILRLQGEKVIPALQGQITQDAKLLTQGKSVFTDICTPKGRVIASALLVPADDGDVLMLADTLQGQKLCDHLNKYLMFHRVRVAPDSALVCLAEANGAILSDEFPSAALSPQLTLQLLPQTTAEAIWLQDTRTKGGAHAWQTLLMLHGICWVGADLSELYTPHHLNHPALAFVSFKKGCYIGQEIIARMEYKAKLKTRCVLLSGESQPETDVLTDTQGIPSGKIIKQHRAEANQWLAFAEVRTDALTEDTILQAGDKILRPIQPPYAINNES